MFILFEFTLLITSNQLETKTGKTSTMCFQICSSTKTHQLNQAPKKATPTQPPRCQQGSEDLETTRERPG